ncbi:MAG: hypothetical protein ACJ8F3_13255 [Xanthobacteraceae bacterium]
MTTAPSTGRGSQPYMGILTDICEAVQNPAAKRQSSFAPGLLYAPARTRR